MKDPFIQVYPKVLSLSECKSIITRFEADNVHKKSQHPNYLPISTLESWKDVDKMLFEKLSTTLKSYEEYLHTNLNAKLLTGFNIKDTGYLLRKFPVGNGEYDWVNDLSVNENRILTYMWFLNDVKEGGELLFKTEKPIKPKAGTLLIFPGTWNYLHKGTNPISSDKYVITGHISRHVIQQKNEDAETI